MKLFKAWATAAGAIFATEFVSDPIMDGLNIEVKPGIGMDDVVHAAILGAGVVMAARLLK